MASGAAEIARSLSAIGWRPGLALCLTGGIGPSFAAHLPPEMQSELIPPQGEPLTGAIALARDLAKEQAR